MAVAVNSGGNASRLRADGTFTDEKNFEKRDPKQGPALSIAQIRERLKQEKMDAGSNRRKPDARS